MREIIVPSFETINAENDFNKYIGYRKEIPITEAFSLGIEARNNSVAFHKAAGAKDTVFICVNNEGVLPLMSAEFALTPNGYASAVNSICEMFGKAGGEFADVRLFISER